MDTTYMAGGNVTWTFLPLNGIAKVGSPTADELNAGLSLTYAASVSDTSLNTAASDTSNNPSFGDSGNVEDRGYSQFSGDMSFFLPKHFHDPDSEYSLAFDALRTPKTVGYIVKRVDGERTDDARGNYAQGDFVTIYKVITDGYTNVNTGSDPFRMTISFKPQGTMKSYVVVNGPTPNAIEVTHVTASVVAGTSHQLLATFGGRFYTNGLAYSSSDPATVDVNVNGAYTGIKAGTATITLTEPETGVTKTTEITVTAG